MQAEQIKTIIDQGGGVFKRFFFGEAANKPALLVIFSEKGETDLLSLPVQYCSVENVRDEIVRSHWFGWLVLAWRRWSRSTVKPQQRHLNYSEGTDGNSIAANFRKVR